LMRSTTGCGRGPAGSSGAMKTKGLQRPLPRIIPPRRNQNQTRFARVRFWDRRSQTRPAPPRAGP
jgi:hypothetical protein